MYIRAVASLRGGLDCTGEARVLTNKGLELKATLTYNKTEE